jgi:2-isopropylmalate synthase
VPLDENLRMIEDSIAEASRRVPEVMFDAEHFFDGYVADPGYALACLEVARRGGARWIILCDTNGGRLPHEIAAIVERVATVIPPEELGIHTHNDTENAVANTLAAVRAGARQVQGTLNGLGERCGNANLVSLIPTLMLKMGYQTGVTDAGLRHLTDLSRALDERLNRIPDRHAAYVGACAFTHKAGLHASAVAKDPRAYEHVPPETVGNRRHIAVSDQAGRANLLTRLGEIGLAAPGEAALRELLAAVKEREANGYAYEGAEASFELLARRALGQVPDHFRQISFRIIDERRYNARNALVTLSEATIKVEVGGTTRMIVAEGNGPVHALDTALRQALSPAYPALEHMHLADYKVRILTPEAGAAAVTRVIIESADERGRRWSTVGVSTNVIDASYAALHDAITYKLFAEGAEAAR